MPRLPLVAALEVPGGFGHHQLRLLGVSRLDPAEEACGMRAGERGHHPAALGYAHRAVLVRAIAELPVVRDIVARDRHGNPV